MRSLRLLSIVFVVVVSASCSSPSESPELQVDMFKDRIDEGAAVIDVRTPEEYASGHIPGSQNLNVKDPSFEEMIRGLDKLKPYAVYCASGVRSGKAAEIMSENGFTNVFTLSEGIKTWKEKGYPIE